MRIEYFSRSNPAHTLISVLFHPWMDGVITVQGKAQNLPNYPVYASGARLSKLPIYNFTPDGKIEAGLTIRHRVFFYVRCINMGGIIKKDLTYDWIVIRLRVMYS